jgi:predicted amidohydrolase
MDAREPPMTRSVMTITAALALCLPAAAEDIWRMTFDGAPAKDLLARTWGDEPAEALANGAAGNLGREGWGGRLHLRFGDETPSHLSYWNLKPDSPIPIVPQLEEISFWVKANVPVSIKIGIGTFGFIYHGPTVQPSAEWQKLAVLNAYQELKAWCARGERNADDAFVTDIIVAVGTSPNVEADIAIDDAAFIGPEGANQTIREEARKRRFKRIRASVVTLPWSDEGRSLESVLDRLDEAGMVGSDIVCLPMECVKTEGEPIPGPLSSAIAEKAKQYGMYVIGNLREVEAVGLTPRPPLLKGEGAASTARPPLLKGEGAASTARPPLLKGEEAASTARPPLLKGEGATSTARPPLLKGEGATSTTDAATVLPLSLQERGSGGEARADKHYATSFLCDRTGQIVGKYRKSHKMPDEDMDLGDDLPVFSTDFAQIALRIGSDRFFADIDHVYTAKGARMIFWSQAPEPVEDEYQQDMPSEGRAADYNVFIACARYSRAADGWITCNFPPYRGSEIGRSYIINREGERIASTTRKGSVATAVIPADELRGAGRGADPKPAFKALTDPVVLPEPRQWAKRQIRVTAIENHVGLDDLLGKLDEAGKLGTDIVCTYEFVWISGGPPEKVEKQTAAAKENLKRVAEKAKQWGMYVLIAGVVDRLERNEAILYGRDGSEVGRYFKIAKTHDEQIPGEDTPILETDFGRIGVRICADEWMVELDRTYGVKGADILFTPTQSWGPDALLRNLRDTSRAMDAQLFHVQATHGTQETMHRSLIIEPTGVPVARTQYRSNGITTAIIDLDHDRPQRFIRNWKPHEPKGYLPEYQDTEVPEMANDLKETILRQRRPELYQVLAPKPSAP